MADELNASTLEDAAEQEQVQTNEEDAHNNDQRGIAEENDNLEPLNVEITPTSNEISERPPQPSTSADRISPTPLYDDPSDDDDGEGEWITPSNVALHKSRAMDLLPQDDAKGKGKKVKTIGSGCMTADFAMQNVLLQMGLNLVGLEGKRIERIKSWVLRCHACFKYGPFPHG